VSIVRVRVVLHMRYLFPFIRQVLVTERNKAILYDGVKSAGSGVSHTDPYPFSHKRRFS